MSSMEYHNYRQMQIIFKNLTEHNNMHLVLFAANKDVAPRAAVGRPTVISREDSFDRPDSPLFHETLPLPAESAIRRHRQRSRGRAAASRSSSESESAAVAVVDRGAQRRQRRQQRRRAVSAGAKTRHSRSTARTRFD